jgi:glycine/D-amino acid oxidase-like deaminating enzyme
MDSIWTDSSKDTIEQNILLKNIETDVCIVGAGIFGITCAYYLSNLGFNVAILEKDKIASKTTAFTTAKITSQHGLFYDYLITSYGEKLAKDYLESNEKAIQNIKDIVDKEKIKCDFEKQNNYIYTTKKSEISILKKEIDALNSLGFKNCDFVTKTGLPFEVQGAVCFKNQAQFHSLKYVYGLCKKIISNNGKFYINTVVSDIENDGDSYLVYANRNIVKAKYVIFASHYPFLNIPGFYFTKMYQSTSYIIAIDPKKTLFNGMYLSYSNPTLSFRRAKYNGQEILLIGGGDHKTGQPSSYKDTYDLLENEAKKYYPNCEILFKWNTEDCISLDKIPYIGNYSVTMPNVFVGTGFKKWGMTSSNVAANIIVDKICNKANPYEYVYRSTRLKPIKNSDEFKNMLVQSTNSLLLNKLRRPNMNFEQISNNSGSIIEVNNEKVGIYKDSIGKVYAVNPICTHLRLLAFLE